MLTSYKIKIKKVFAFDISFIKQNNCYISNHFFTSLTYVIIILSSILCANTSLADIFVYNSDGTFLKQASLSVANTSTDTIGKTITITSPQTITENLVLSEDRMWKVEKGGVLSIVSGKYLTINGTLQAGQYQIFNGKGTISFGNKSNHEVRPEWFGDMTAGNNTYNSIMSAIKSITGIVGTVSFKGFYDIGNNTFKLPSNITLIGNGSTITKSSNSKNARIFFIKNVNNVKIKEFILDGNYKGASSGSNPVIEIGDLSTHSSDMFTENIWIENNHIKNGNHSCVGIYGETDTGVAGNKNINVTNNKLERAGTGVFVYKGADGIHISGNSISSVGAVGIVLDTRAATDSNIKGVYPIINTTITNNVLTDIGGDEGFQGTGMTLKGKLENIQVTGNTISNVRSDSVRNTYGILVAQSYGAGKGAAATAKLTGSSVSSFTVTDGGYGYSIAPTVFLTSGSGAGAAGTAIIQGGVVKSIKVNTGGEKYASAPYIQIIAGDIPKSVLIDGNIIDGVASTGGTLGWPIYVQSGCSRITISNNKISNTNRGINIDAADNVSITNNIITDIPKGGPSLFPIYIVGTNDKAQATNIRIEKNIITNGSGHKSTHAMAVVYADNVLITNNHTSGFSTGSHIISKHATNIKYQR